ncbi:MAG: GerMN domain-containing protein [Candidatus Margulisiibacteriota bacterium]
MGGYLFLSRYIFPPAKEIKANLEVKVFYFKRGKLFAVPRPLRADEVPLKKAIVELLAGPTEKETAKGIVSYLPTAVKLINLKVQGNTAILNFNQELENYGGGSARLQGMIAQIVFTATDIPGIEKAWIWMEGQKEIVLGGEGLVLDHPLTRREISY